MTRLGDRVSLGVDDIRILSERPLDSGRPRLSFPTLDVAAGAPPKLPGEGGADAGLLAFLGAPLPAPSEAAARYLAHVDGELGRGGIGRVFLALDRDLGRDVAVKELLVAEADEGERPLRLQALARFLREARITGQLEHPNIVPVYELGQSANGTPYYAMRVVRGRTLSRALAEATNLAERLALLDHFVGLCQAVAFAHSRGVVHRDIKPDNVMIGEFGETVVLDWGMAKCREQDVEVAGPVRPLEAPGLELTIDGSLCGTPTHMSPEQARGASDEVDERSDVWALGVVLYTILSGRTPFSGNTLPELIKKIQNEKAASLNDLDADIPRELSAIAERALQPTPSERYATAKELLTDVNAFRSGARVRAYDYSSFELVRRFIARHRAAAVASAIGIGVASTLAVGSYVRLAAARDRAVLAERHATENEKRARSNEQNAKRTLGEMLVDRAEQALSEGDRTGAELLASEALNLVERADARGLTISAESGPRPQPLRTLRDAAGCARSALEFGARHAACARGASVTVYDLSGAEPPRSFALRAAVTALDFSASGGHLVVASDDGAVALFDLQSGATAPVFERVATRVSALAVSPRADYVAVGGARGGVVIWELSGRRRSFRTEMAQGVSQLGFAPNEPRLLIGGQLGALHAWDFAENKSRELVGHTGTLRAFAFAQQGRLLASAGSDRTIRFWNLGDQAPSFPAVTHTDAVTALSWIQDGRVLAFGSKDKSFHVVDLKNAEEKTEVRFHDDSVDALAASADGGELASMSRDLGVESWSLASLKLPSTLLERGNVLSFAFVPGKAELVSGSVAASGVGIWSLVSGNVETRLPAAVEQVRSLAVSLDGERLAFAGSSSQVILWDLPRRVPLRVFDDAHAEVRAVAFSADGASLAFAGLDRTLRVVDARTFAKLAELENGSAIQALSFSSTARVWSGDREGQLVEWDLRTKRPLLQLKAHGDWILSLSTTRDGARVVTGGADRRVKIWDSRDGRLLLDLEGHEGRVLSVEFSPDGRLVASGAEDKSVRLWDVERGREVATIRGHRGAVRAVHFAEQGSLLASASDDGTVRLWRLERFAEPGVELRRRVERDFGVALAGTRVTRAR
jgi:WD40 repeat protein